MLLDLPLRIFSRFLRTLLRLDLAAVLQLLFEIVGLGDKLFGLEEDLENGHLSQTDYIEGACHYVL